MIVDYNLAFVIGFSFSISIFIVYSCLYFLFNKLKKLYIQWKDPWYFIEDSYKRNGAKNVF